MSIQAPTPAEIALARLEVQYEHLADAMKRVESLLTADLAAIKAENKALEVRVAALEKDRVERESQKKTAVWLGEKAWVVVVFVATAATTALQFVGKKLGWF